MTLEDLNSRPIASQILAEAIDVHNAVGFNPLKDDASEPDLDELQFYVVRVGSALASTMEWLRQLEQAIHLLGDYSHRRSLSDVGLTRWHHVTYNVENYEIRVQSVYDRLLHLANRDPQLDRLALLYMHTRATWVDSPKYTFERLRQHRAQRLREITGRLGSEFRQLNDALATAIEPLFDELLLQYKRQKVRLERAV